MSLELLFDRAKNKPFSVSVGAPPNVFTTRGLLQGYGIDQRADHRIVKTFSGDTFFYFFGESVPMLQLNLIMSSGLLYQCVKKNKDSNECISKSYPIDILDIVSKGYLLYGKDDKESEIQPATIMFNKLNIYGYIVSAIINGSSQTPGTSAVNIQVVVKKMKSISNEKDETVS